MLTCNRFGRGNRMKTLRDVKVGQSARVVKLHGQGALKRRIMDMGITKGVEIHVRKVAPLGDPLELTIRGYQLTLRKEDAARMTVTLFEDASDLGKEKGGRIHGLRIDR